MTEPLVHVNRDRCRDRSRSLSRFVARMSASSHVKVSVERHWLDTHNSGHLSISNRRLERTDSEVRHTLYFSIASA